MKQILNSMQVFFGVDTMPTSYLIDRDGRLVDNYLSWTSPQSDRIINAVEGLL